MKHFRRKVRRKVRNYKDTAKNVLLVLDIGVISGRQRLVGIFRYMRQTAVQWNIKLVSSCSLRHPHITDTDGIIVVEDRPTRIIMKNRVKLTPIVALDAMDSLFKHNTENIVRINVDDDAIGRMAAEHLVSRGKLRTLAYVPSTQSQRWSDIRCLSIEKEAKRRGIAFCIFHGTDETLSKWILSLPLPCGILASNHRRAVNVIEAIHTTRLKIPQQIIVAGVDNDEIFCNYASPTITCVDLDFEKEGFIAAAELDTLMKTKNARNMKSMMLPPHAIIERESTAYIAPATHIVERALDFIKKNAVNGIKVKDVVREVRVSRRLADLRFRQLQGETINKCIKRHQLERVARLLKGTKLPICEITKLCGFSSDKYLKRLFLKQFGVTMREWRSLNRNHTT